MAYSSRGSGSRSRSRSTGRSGSGGGGGGGASNAGPMVIAGIALVVVVSLVFILTKKKDPPKEPAPTLPSMVNAPTPGPTGPKPLVKGPLPQMPADLLRRARAMMPEVKTASEKGTALYNEAIKAKDAGDQDTWQAKMEEARELLKLVRDKWISIEEEVQVLIEAKVPENWKADEAVGAMFDANLKDEASKMRSLIDEPLSRMAKTGRGH